MDETMDTSDTIEISDEDQDNNEAEQSLSPVFDRRTIRNLRTRRNAVSSRRLLSASEEETSSSNREELNETAGPQHEQDILDTSPPPIEDTDLIMIHRPLLPLNRVSEASDSVSEVVIIASADTTHQNLDIANERSDPALETPSGDYSSDSMIQEQDRHSAAEMFQDEDSQEPVTDEMSSAAPDIENLPLAQRIRSPDLLPPDQNPFERDPSEQNPLERSPDERSSPEQNLPERNLPERNLPERSAPERSPPLKKVKVDPQAESKDESYEEEEGKLCPICFDAWTNSGDHRLVSLRCGHLFGKHCIEHWLQIHKASDRKCPQCKKKATAKDIRPLYALKIRVLDTSEQEALKETIKKLEEEKERLSRELAFERQMHQDALKIQQEQQMKLQELQSKGILGQSLHSALPATSKQVAAIAAQIKINQTARIEVARDGGCRVLAFNEWKGVLVASQSQVTPLFPDFGIRLIDTEEFRLRQLIPMHTKAIRDLSFNPHRKDLLLSASLDKTVKMFCLSSNASVMTFNPEVPMWSCCWDGNNTNLFFAGSQNGITFQYDIRNTHTEVSRIATPGDGTPVMSLASIPGGSWVPNGGFLSCRLSRLRLYERTSNSEFRPNLINVDGPFSALNYDHKTQHMLVSTKPTSQNPHAQHRLYEMGFAASQLQTNVVHCFEGSTTQRVLSRPCQLEIDGNVKDKLICANQESEGHVAIWSVRTGQKVPAGPLICSEPIMDLCPIKGNNHTYLAALSDKSLRVYQFST